jgi:hypothetical protein
MQKRRHDLILTGLACALMGALIGAMLMATIATGGEPCNSAPDPIACLIERAGP